jgi:hypothetical protein
MKNGLHFGGEVHPVSAKAGKRMGRTPFRYCKCGFPNDTRSTAWAEGANDGDGGVVWNPATSQHDVVMGCAFCGRVQWLDRKPVALPDDENLPSKWWLRRHGRR